MYAVNTWYKPCTLHQEAHSEDFVAFYSTEIELPVFSLFVMNENFSVD